MSKRISDISPVQSMINDTDKFEIEDVTGSTPGISKQTDALTIAEYIQGKGIAATFGRMTFQGNSAETVIAASATPVKINGTYVAGNLLGFSHVNGTLTRTATETVQCLVVVKTTSTFNLASGSLTIFIKHQSTVLTDSGQSPDLDAVSPSFKPVVCQALVEVAQGETIEVFIQNDNATDNITAQDLDCIIISTGGGLSPIAKINIFSQISTLTVTNTTVETTLNGAGTGTLTFPPNSLSVGSSFTFHLSGTQSIILASPENEMRIRLKSATADFFNTGLQPGGGTPVLSPYAFNVVMTVRATGIAGVAEIRASMTSDLFAAPISKTLIFVNSTTFDTTVENVLELTVQYPNIASTQNTINSQLLVFSNA